MLGSLLMSAGNVTAASYHVARFASFENNPQHNNSLREVRLADSGAVACSLAFNGAVTDQASVLAAELAGVLTAADVIFFAVAIQCPELLLTVARCC